MIRIAEAVKGMRVVTPRGLVARVEGVALDTSDAAGQRLNLTYLDPQEGAVTLQAKLLRGYEGDPVVFRDEADSLRLKHGDVPLPPPGGSVRAAPPPGVVRPSAPASLRLVSPRRADDEGRG